MKVKKIVTLCDPPSGWVYGFPKILPESAKGAEFFAWLVSEGYPQAEIDGMGDYFYSKYWQEEIEVEEPDPSAI